MTVASSNSMTAAAGLRADEASRFAEQQYIERSRNGCGESFGKLVEAYQDRVFSVIYRMVGHRQDAEELTQEAFLRAYTKLDSFRGGSRFYTWLFRIAANLALSHRRRRRKVTFHSLSPIHDDGPQPAQREQAELARLRTPDPTSKAMRAETTDRIALALAELDDEFRPAVVLRDVGEMDYADIAETLQLPIGTVKSRIHRGRCVLREKLRDLVAP